ncbi:nephrocan-like [Anneissia japonica]|uniref:nephrocan-like n=1 Tax=Anneissia japonica TaxID=1529436 RepID=UPI001425A73A|nr:nephrocan-like [Anneissia japonica]XP_033099253.1 nephrocan-like [Anneissia japonica]XP_033099254.1 nephrocan-like [Anneissia japonica]XP_033099255.1 nephrocan-like [Anneissia japonica]XP_033099256.1 nephrocan-like [Anneissia japonica]
MKHLHRQFNTRKQCIESLKFTLITKQSGSCLLSTFPTFRASYQRGFTTRFLFLVTYLLSSFGTVYGMCPAKCECDNIYQSLECSNVDILEIPKNIPNSTRFISITNTQISEIKRLAFFSLHSLRMISLENNLINTVSNDCFNTSKKLRKLNLNGNRLLTFPEALFGLKRINEIHLQGNDMTILNPDKPVILQKLHFLDLESNRLTEVTRKFFDSMSKLNTLNMSFNQIRKIDTDWLRPMINLKVLELEEAFEIAPAIGEWFFCESSSSLTSINMAYNRIISIPPRTFSCVPNLKFLILNNNNLVEFPSNMSLQNVERLDLGSNQIAHLTGDTFESCKNLTTLDLSSNNLRGLPNGVFRTLNRLESLDLNNNYLTNIQSDTFANLPFLKHLLLSGNKLQVLPPRLLSLHVNLINVDLSVNNIESIPDDIFQPTTLLKQLTLNNNSLVQLPNIRNLRDLQYLDVSWNLLNVISPDAFEGTLLRTINLGSNKINTFYSVTLERLMINHTLTALILDGNPLRCDCMTVWLTLVPMNAVSDFQCAYPNRLSESTFHTLDYFEKDYLVCDDEIDTEFIQKVIIIWFSMLLLVVLVYWLMVYHKTLRLWRAWSPTKRKRKREVGNSGKSNAYYRISTDNFWNNNSLFTHRMTSSFRRVRLTESLQSNEYLETIV